MQANDVLGTLIDDALKGGRTVRFRAAGTSMQPAICDGESIAVAPVDAATVRPGAVLLCRHEGRRLLAHRVVAVTRRDAGRYFELRGDAKGASDAPIAADAIVGRVVGVWRNGRLAPVGPRRRLADSVYHRVATTIARAASRARALVN